MNLCQDRVAVFGCQRLACHADVSSTGRCYAGNSRSVHLARSRSSRLAQTYHKLFLQLKGKAPGMFSFTVSAS
jgi:hypothetical protein